MRSCRWILSAALCLAALFLLAVPTWAEPPEQSWSLEEGVLCISGQGEMDFSTPLPWEDSKEEITALRVDEGITAIQAEALKDCTALKSVTLPKSLRYIHDSAFENCTALCWVTYPEGLIGIGQNAFAGCTQLSTVFLPGSVAWVGDGAFGDKTLINGTAGTGVQDYIQANGGTFRQVDLHKLASQEGTWAGGTWTLSGGELTVSGKGDVALEEGERYYPWDSLRGDITDVTLEEGVTAVDAGAFSLCRKLVSVTFPASIETVDENALDAAPEILGYSGTAAESFAEAKGLDFTALDTAETEPAEETAATEEAPDASAPQTEETTESRTEETVPTKTADTTEPQTEETAAADETQPETAETEPVQKLLPILTVSSESAQPGQTVKVTVTLANNPGLCGLNFQIDYDSSLLTLEDFDCPNEAFAQGDWTVGLGEGEKALWIQPDQTEENGAILTLLFRISQQAPQGEIPVALTEVSGVNDQAELLEVTCHAGSVQVTVGIPGDINGDGRVTAADLLRLRRYLAGQNVLVETGNADLNGDGQINLSDLMLLQKLLTGTAEN